MTNAATISRKLAEGGHRPLGSGASRMRQGLRVNRSLSAIAFVSADYDSAGAAARASANAAEILNGAGFEIKRVSPSLFSVHAKEEK